MAISAPDRPPGVRETDGVHPDPSEDQPARTGKIGDAPPIIEDGVISDARRRARRRRTGYTLIAAAAAAAALAVAGGGVALFGGPPDAPAGAPEPNRSDVLAAPAAEAAVVGMWAKIHDGWVYVYDDGRVLSLPDRGPIVERHLSPYGVDVVREGVLDPQSLVRPQRSIVPVEAWSDPAPHPYLPSQYAVCHLSLVPDPDPDVLSDVGLIWDRLPEHVQALLRAGHVQSFTDEFVDENGDFVGPDGYHSEPGPGVDCFVLSAGRTQALWAHTSPQSGDPGQDNEFRASDTTFSALKGTDGSEFVVVAIPIMPHGGWVLWGG